MIDINNISCGWAILKIGYCSFEVSYLSDVKKEIDSLLDLENEYSSNKINLEGEGAGDLTLVSHLTFGDLTSWYTIEEEKMVEREELSKYGNIINIIWQRTFSKEDSSIAILKFPFDKFKEEWKILCSNMKDEYILDFLMPHDNEEKEEYYNEYDI